MNPSVEETIEFIKVMHADQTDWSGLPYWQHPVAVMNLLPPDSPLEWKLIALLHDVIEDSKAAIAAAIGVGEEEVTVEVAMQFLRDRGYSEYVVEGVRLLTRDKSQPYEEEIARIVASGHVGAMHAKFADNTHNTSEARYAVLSEAQRARALRIRPIYEASKAMLREGLVALGYTV